MLSERSADPTETAPTEAQRPGTLQQLEAFASAQNELGRLFARSRGMHTTDAAAIVQILEAEERGTPLTPVRLSERIALTTGATSILLNRLEDAGHVVRTREHADRRLVTLRTTPSIRAAADAYYAPLGRQLQAVLDTYRPEDLAVVDSVVGHLRATMTAHMIDTGPVDPRRDVLSS